MNISSVKVIKLTVMLEFDQMIEIRSDQYPAFQALQQFNPGNGQEVRIQNTNRIRHHKKEICY